MLKASAVGTGGSGGSMNRGPWAPARGEQGGQAPTLEKIRTAHPGNFSRGLKTSWQ